MAVLILQSIASGKVLETVSGHLKLLNFVDSFMPGLKATNPDQCKIAMIFEQPHLCVAIGEPLFTMLTLHHPVWTF